MSEQMANNKQTVASFFQHVTAGDMDAAFELVHDDVEWWVPGALPFSGTKNKAQYLKVVSAIKTGFPSGFELRVVNDMMADGDWVAAEVESFGTHANGREYRNKYHFKVRMCDGKMREVKEYMDTQHLAALIAQ
eukprot:TRINITY_DN15794_c0_g1_i1.p2 TRINITY_DN15794_c0_g1~~TRINITY_DN15794_c0_g1_i1.p2  ORF type:complete len:145 (+),score=53.60 TRINITY_DN15794_c0_g1_i1:36-437(+)